MIKQKHAIFRKQTKPDTADMSLPRWYKLIAILSVSVLILGGLISYFQIAGWPDYIAAYQHCGHKPIAVHRALYGHSYFYVNANGDSQPSQEGIYFCSEQQAKDFIAKQS